MLSCDARDGCVAACCVDRSAKVGGETRDAATRAYLAFPMAKKLLGLEARKKRRRDAAPAAPATPV